MYVSQINPYSLLLRIHLCTNNYRAIILLHPKPRVKRLREVVVECVNVSQSPRGHTVEGQGAAWAVQIDPDPVGGRRRCWYFHRLLVMLSGVVILTAVQTPGLVSRAKPTKVITCPPTDSPHG